MNKLERKDLLTRRKAVLREVENNSIILIYGSKNIIKTNDIEYDFRQDSDFLYLIGIKESNLVSLILKKDNKSKVILFRDESSEFESSGWY
jgi:Aminopeptidase P, N-terminal domain.